MASKDEMLRRPIIKSTLHSRRCSRVGDYHLGRLGHRQQDKPVARQQVQTALVAADASLCREVQGSGAWQTDGRRRSKRLHKVTDNGVGRVSAEPPRTAGCRNLNRAREQAP
jgi:hypothetical protein